MSKDLIFDFVYLDPPYGSDYYAKVLSLLRDCKFISEKTIIICELSKSNKYEIDNFWKIDDERVYGQTKIKFLVKV